MNLFGLEIGSWAEWLGSISTFVAVLIALQPQFKKLKRSDLFFQILVMEPEENQGLVNFKVDIINPNERVEIFRIDSIEIGYVEPFAFIGTDFRISDFDLQPFRYIPTGYSIPCAGASRVNDAIDKQPIVEMLNVHNTRRYLIKVNGITQRDGDNYSVASFFDVESSGVKNIRTITKKNMKDTEFDQLLQQEYSDIRLEEKNRFLKMYE